MALLSKKSRRVVWDQPGGTDFRLTWGRLAAFITLFFAAIGAVPVYWTISDHWMNRQEIKEAMKAHADHDSGVQAWNQYGFAANRLEYLDDKQAECQNKMLVKGGKLAADDAANCSRYETKYKSKVAEANDLKAKAMEATKEKQ